MSFFVFLRGKSFRFYTIIIILILQGRQCETKRYLDIYTTLTSYTVPKESDDFLQINYSLAAIVEMPSNSTAMSKLWSHPAISFRMKFADKIVDVQAHVNISAQRGDRYDTYLSTSLDVCKTRYAKVEQPFVRYLRDELIRLLKPNAECPINKNVLYEMNNLVLSNKFLPVYAPPLNWRSDIKMWFNGRYSVELVTIGKIEWINI